MSPVTPCLWFNHSAEAAANFYVSVFNSAFKQNTSRIMGLTRYGKTGSRVSGQPKGSVMTVNFLLHRKEFLALNGGPEFKFTPAVSFIVNCDTQEEVDSLWEQLSEGGEEIECGWLTDRFGVTWQIVPAILWKMTQDKDPARSDRVMAAMVKMKKLDIDLLRQAYDQTE